MHQHALKKRLASKLSAGAAKNGAIPHGRHKIECARKEYHYLSMISWMQSEKRSEKNLIFSVTKAIINCKWGEVGKSGEKGFSLQNAYFLQYYTRKGEIAVLIGEHRCALDDKGRLNFPAKFREEMGDNFIVTRWLDDCLVAFPNGEWERISAQLAEKSVVKSRDVQRFLYAGASEAAPDKQGRILIPGALRQHASLEKDVVVIGVGRHAEIWDAEAWRGMTGRLDSGSIASAMEELEF